MDFFKMAPIGTEFSDLLPPVKHWGEGFPISSCVLLSGIGDSPWNAYV